MGTIAATVAVAVGARSRRSQSRRSPIAAAIVPARTAAPALTEQDTIVLADFENTTGEPVFDGALKVALAVALEQSPFLKVFPDDRARGDAAADAARRRTSGSRARSRARSRGASS